MMQKQFSDQVIMLISGLDGKTPDLHEALRVYNLLKTMDDNERLELMVVLMFALIPRGYIWSDIRELASIIQNKIPEDMLQFMNTPPPSQERVET